MTKNEALARYQIIATTELRKKIENVLHFSVQLAQAE